MSSYSKTYKPVNNVPIVTAATGYTACYGKEYVLTINERLWLPDLNHTLNIPNQLRHYGIQYRITHTILNQ